MNGLGMDQNNGQISMTGKTHGFNKGAHNYNGYHLDYAVIYSLNLSTTFYQLNYQIW